MQPGLNLNNLKYFYDAVETQSISEAARRNFVTQSAVSQGILKLENALKVPLITHQRNCFKLTPEGQTVFMLTQQIFRSLKVMNDMAQEMENVISGEVNLVCTQSIAINIISTMLQKLKIDYPLIQLKIKIAKIENICLMLKRGIMDVGIVVESQICEQFDRQILRSGFFHLYAKDKQKNAINDGIYVDHASGLYVDKLSEIYRKKFKRKLKIAQELDSWQVSVKCAEASMGWCFLPDFLLASEEAYQVFGGLSPIPYNIVSIYPKGVQLTRATKTILNLLTNKAKGRKLQGPGQTGHRTYTTNRTNRTARQTGHRTHDIHDYGCCKSCMSCVLYHRAGHEMLSLLLESGSDRIVQICKCIYFIVDFRIKTTLFRIKKINFTIHYSHISTHLEILISDLKKFSDCFRSLHPISSIFPTIFRQVYDFTSVSSHFIFSWHNLS